jgi:hypothetical protein
MRIDDFYNVMSRDWTHLDKERASNLLRADRRLEFVRLFESLGFCEVDWEKRKIFAIPAGWFMLPALGLPVAVLIGGRSPGMMKQIRAVCGTAQQEIQLIEHSRAWAGASFPGMVAVQGASYDALTRLAMKTVPLRGRTPGSWDLLNSCSGIQSVLDGLKFEVFHDPGWPKKIFDVSRLMFQSPDTPGLDGSILHVHTNPSSQVRMHVVWKDGRGAPVHRDWGRYYALWMARKNVLHYCEVANALAVPVTVPLPALIQRSISLCTGRLPRQISLSVNGPENQDQMPFNVHPGVPPSIAKLAASHLGQELQVWEPKSALRSELCLTAIQ